MYEIKFEKKTEIIYACFRDEISWEEFIDYLHQLGKLDLPAEIKLFQDHRQATSETGPADLQRIFEAYQNHFKNKQVKLAYLSDRPRAMALAQLFKGMCESSHISVETFSSEEAATNWLNNKAIFIF